MIFYPFGPTTFDLINNPEWIQLQEQEIYIHCDTSLGQVDIILPEIVKLNGFYNLKVYVVDITGDAGSNNIVISTSALDSIDGGSSITLNENAASTAITIVSSKQWISLEGIAATGANIADLGSILFVSDFGDDSTGTRGRIDLPYKTIVGAQIDAEFGDTVYVFPGEFFATNLGKDGLTYYFSAGASLSQPIISPNAHLFSDNALALGGSYSILGQGDFTNLYSSILAQFKGSIIYFEGNNCVTSNSGPAAFYSESTVAGGNPKNTTQIVVHEITSAGNGIYLYVEDSESEMSVSANKITATATTIVTFDASATGAKPPILRVNAQSIINDGSAVDSITIHNIGGKLYVNCPNIIKRVQSPGAPVVYMKPSSPNQEGYVEINGTINYEPTTIAASDFILSIGAGSSKISANIYGDAPSIYSGGSNVTGYSHYLEGYIESNVTDVPTITIQSGTEHNVFVNALVRNKAISGTTSHGIECAQDNALVVMQNCVIQCPLTSNSVSAPTLSITSYNGSCGNAALNVGAELVGNITVDAAVIVPKLNP